LIFPGITAFFRCGGMALEDSENFEALGSVLRNTEDVTAAV
jgi:hypothetical protein